MENLIKLPQRFWEPPKGHIRICLLSEQIHIARVEPLRFLEVSLAAVPLALPARDIGKPFRNAAAIGQKVTCLLKVTHCSVVILQARIIVTSLSQYGLPETRL